MSTNTNHSASAAALGFYFQSFFALHALLQQPQDGATVCLERLDDVEIKANGLSLLMQLKHSLAASPVAVTLSSKSLWRTLKAWIDVLPKIVIEETRFQLVTVAPLGSKDVLGVLLDPNEDRRELYKALVIEAKRVVEEYTRAVANGDPTIPHVDRLKDCEAFLNLAEDICLTLLKNMAICPKSTNIANIQVNIESTLTNFPPDRRSLIASRLLQWWDLQVVFTLCGKRERWIGKIEVQKEISDLAGEIEREELIPDFESTMPPFDYQPGSNLVRQIELVRGAPSDVRVATREEWRAREQRHKWLIERLDMATRIGIYDLILEEAWLDKYERMVESVANFNATLKCESGLQLLRWSQDEAYKEVPPFAKNWSARYYVRGSYQVLAINMQVGWHPEYKTLLGAFA